MRSEMTNMRGGKRVFLCEKSKKSQPGPPPPNAKIKKYEKPKNRKKRYTLTDTRKTSNYSIDVPSMGNYAMIMTNMRGVENAFFVLKVEKKSTSPPP